MSEHPFTNNTSLTLDQQLARARIVLVDDDPAITSVIAELLNIEGYPDIQVINDASAAFDTISSLQPDAVLLDWHMPGISG